MATHSKTSSPPLSRKDIAALLNFRTSEQVQRNEASLGLDKCRCDVNTRVVLYNAAKTIAALQSRGLI